MELQRIKQDLVWRSRKNPYW